MTVANGVLLRWQMVLSKGRDEAAVFSAAGGVLRTFADIEAEAAGLVGKVEGGTVIGIQIGNTPAWPALLLACFRAGTVPLPLGMHIEAAERSSALQRCGAGGLVMRRDERLVFENLNTANATSLPESAQFLKLTSGTTSAPRAIAFTADQLVADCDNICGSMGIGADDLNFGVIPFSHSYGFSNLITPLLCRGVRLVVSEDRMPRAMLDGLDASGATVFPGMPVFYQNFAELERIPELPALRLCISAGAPLPKRVGEEFTARFGRKIHTFYGASECGGIGYDVSEEPRYEEGFLGMPMRNVAITHGADGVIEVRSGAVGLGYFPEPEPETLGRGRFTPSDLIRRTDRGLQLVGRISDIINVAGRKLNPAEVETQLLRFEGVKQAMVFGVPSSSRTEEPIACVAGQSGVPLNKVDLLRFCRANLSAWQVPRDIWILEEIPANERGKTSRRELARRYQELRANGEGGTATNNR
jgi:long-chain acyl-CoA synthetase